MAFVPTFRILDSTGVSTVYTFPAVNFTNEPQSVRDTVVITNLRAKGGIAIDGGEKPWTLEIHFTLLADDYEEMIALIDTLESTIAINTPYLLRVSRTASTYAQYKIKRLEAFEYPGVETNLRNNIQEVTAKFEVNIW